MKKCSGQIVISILSALVVVAALMLVYSKHVNRQYFAELQLLQLERDSLQEQWGQLLLEQSTLTSHVRIEQLAREKLSMALPRQQKLLKIPNTHP